MTNYYATVLHAFVASSDRELGLKVGEQVLLFNWDDPEWWYGELSGKNGYFPSSHVEILSEEEEDAPPPPPPPPVEEEDEAPPPPPPSSAFSSQNYAVGLWDCNAETDHELSFKSGDKLLVLEDESSEWLFVELRGKKGYVPRNFVDYSTKTVKSTSNASSLKPKRPDASTLPRNAGDDPNKVVAIYDFPAQTVQQLTLRAGDFVHVLERKGDWWRGELNGKSGFFPNTYVDVPSTAAFALIEKNNRDDTIVTPPPVPFSPTGSFVSQNPNVSRTNLSKLATPEPEPQSQPQPKINTQKSTPTVSPSSSSSAVAKATVAATPTVSPSSSSSAVAKATTAATATPAAKVTTTTTAATPKPITTPATKGGKICHGCQGAISGAFMDIDDQYFHKSCFVCSLCSTQLKKFFEKDGKIYCGDCFVHKIDVIPCGRCGKPLGSDVVKACGKRFHDACFTCFNCKTPFHDNLINNRDGQPWCDGCVRQVVPKSNPSVRSTGPPKNSVAVTSGPTAKKARAVPPQYQQQKKKFVSGFD